LTSVAGFWTIVFEVRAVTVVLHVDGHNITYLC